MHEKNVRAGSHFTDVQIKYLLRQVRDSNPRLLVGGNMDRFFPLGMG